MYMYMYVYMMIQFSKSIIILHKTIYSNIQFYVIFNLEV